MKSHHVVGRLALLLFLILTPFFGLSACGCPSPETGPSPSPTTPTTSIESTPLTVLSVAGGEVLVMKAGAAEWVSGEVGMTLGVNDKIKTVAGGHATITFFEGSTIELDGGTEISLSELGLDGTASHIGISQQIGNTVSRVKKLVDPASSYDVETPAAIASVRGTTLSVAVASNGTTVVGNIEGRVSVIAQGVEVELAEGERTTVSPGEPPGPPEPTATTATQRGVRLSPTPTIAVVKIGIIKTCDHQSAFPGDNLTYTYLVSNEGDVPLANISLTDNKAGPPEYISGDENTEGSLDNNETWVFTAVYTVKDDETGQLSNEAIVTGTGPGSQPASASASVTVNITDIIVAITSLEAGEVVGQTVIVSGTVNDPSITEAVLMSNGSPRYISVVDGQFSESVELSPDVTYIITVTVTKYPDITRSDSIKLEPESGGK
jgi:hypothetical protein